MYGMWGEGLGREYVRIRVNICLLLFSMMVKKILIVDDDKKDRDFMKRSLESVGYDVLLAKDGAVALDLLNVNGINVILLDIKMPTLSGYDLLRLLKQRADEELKIIYSSVVLRREVDMEDVDGFLQKPFSSEVLLKTVNEVVGE